MIFSTTAAKRIKFEIFAESQEKKVLRPSDILTSDLNMVLKWENVTETVLFEFFRASVITNLDCLFIKSLL